MTITVLEKIIKQARSTPTDPATIAAELKSVNASIKSADVYAKQIFGIEARSQVKLDAERESLAMRKAVLSHRSKTGLDYPPISLDALRKHRTKAGWPSVAVFCLDSPDFKIEVKGRWRQDPPSWDNRYSVSAKISPELPKAISDCYKDVIAQLTKRCKSEQKSYKLCAAFDGLIPLEVKQKIKEAKHAFKQIFILAEPPAWSLKATAVVQPKVDPLVVGWDGNGLCLIAEFDTTPVEEAIMLEGPANTGR